MQPFTTLTGVAAPLDIMNVDTDMIIPKQYLKTIKRTGLGTGLFSEMRYKEDGSENPDLYKRQRDPLCDLNKLRRYFLQQLFQERHSSHYSLAGRS